jgi:hypothetical protein
MFPAAEPLWLTAVERQPGGGDIPAGRWATAIRVQKVVPEGANLGLGCGNHGAQLPQEGEIVLDLGAGAGFGASLLPLRWGKEGHRGGYDPGMIEAKRAPGRAI